MQLSNESESSMVRLFLLVVDEEDIQSKLDTKRHTVTYREVNSGKRLHLSSSYEGWCGSVFNELIDHGTALAVTSSFDSLPKFQKHLRAMLAIHGITLEAVGGSFETLREAHGDELFSSNRWGRAQSTECTQVVMANFDDEGKPSHKVCVNG